MASAIGHTVIINKYKLHKYLGCKAVVFFIKYIKQL